MNTNNCIYQINKHTVWGLIHLLLFFTGILQGSTQEIVESQIIVSNRITYAKNSEKPYTGKVTQKYQNGKKMHEKTFKDGKQDGRFIKWYFNGQKEVEGSFKDGRREGKWIGWHANGQKRGVVSFKNGKKGSEKMWDAHGKEYKTSPKKVIFRKAQAFIRQLEGACQQTRLDGNTITEWDEEHIKAACYPLYIKNWPVCPGDGKWNFDRENRIAAKIGNATIYSTNRFKDVESNM